MRRILFGILIHYSLYPHEPCLPLVILYHMISPIPPPRSNQKINQLTPPHPQILSPPFLTPLTHTATPIINLHPALPHAYDGANAIPRAYADFQAGRITRTGIMVHYVVDEVDRGEPIVVREVEMREGDLLGDLEERVHEVERGGLVEAVGVVLGGRERGGGGGEGGGLRGGGEGGGG